jgi:hypothetical protein
MAYDMLAWAIRLLMAFLFVMVVVLMIPIVVILSIFEVVENFIQARSHTKHIN